LVVALFGPDGSGKTTVAEALLTRLGETRFRGGHYARRSLGVLPRHRDVKRRLARAAGLDQAAAAPAGPAGHPALLPPVGRLRSLLFPAWQALDLALGRRRLARLRAAGRLVVFDRYFHDCYLQSGSRNAPVWYLDLLERTVPRPDLLLYLDDDADAIFRRKPELPVAEIRRQQAAARRAVARLPHARTLDARGGAEAAVESAVRAVLALMETRR
jgi:thymidylate kinase